MNLYFSGAIDYETAQFLKKLAIKVAIIALILTIATVPAQIGMVLPYSLYWFLSIGMAVIAGIFWLCSLCILSSSRGYHALWGLVLVVPVFIIIYPWLFPDKIKDK